MEMHNGKHNRVLDNTKILPQTNLSRRDMLKGAIVGAAAVGISAADPSSVLAESSSTWLCVTGSSAGARVP
jgi:TAT (twin-arginine translocation) pathway signal sequence